MSQPQDNPLELLVDQALAEYMQKCDSGSAPDREAFLSQHAELREQLSELLSAADWIEQLAGPTLVESPEAFEEELRAQGDFTAQIEETLPLGAVTVARPDAQNTLPANSFDKSRDFSVDEPSGQTQTSAQPGLPCRFGDYVLEKVLGRGGMGVVYYGHQVHLERPVAIKMIRSGALASQEEVQRFYAEARSAAKLDHPNIVTVHQCGECDGHRYFSMDYVPGADLSRMIEDGPLDCHRAARYVRDVARAIQYAHNRGILHRDLKPANVLVDEEDNVRITDFGLAKFIGHETGLTATGAALGTPSYMSPEQAAGRVDEQHHATDVYSMGAILFTIVTGRPPFKSGNAVQTLMQVIHRPAPMARSINDKVPEDIETIIDVCLQKSPERRYPSAEALANDLDLFLRGSPIQARPMPQLRRVWYWLLGVPIFGAVFDHRVVEPTEAHRWVQRGLMSIGLLLVLVWFALLVPSSLWYRNRLPRTVRVAAGISGGSYDQLANAICQLLADHTQCQAISVSSAGSSDNYEKLERGEVDLALLQADAVRSSDVAVVAPLYYEAVHILVKSDAGIASMGQLLQRKVIVGPEKAGSRGVAQLLLGRAGLTLQDIQVDESDWRVLKSNADADAAVIVIRPGNADLVEILVGGKYQLLPIANSLEFAMEEPVFHALLLDPKTYPNCGLPEGGIATVATTAFLAAKFETPAILVQAVLRNLFDPDVVEQNDIFSAERAAHWHGLAWHPAARDFFHSYRGSTAQPVNRP